LQYKQVTKEKYASLLAEQNVPAEFVSLMNYLFTESWMAAMLIWLTASSARSAGRRRTFSTTWAKLRLPGSGVRYTPGTWVPETEVAEYQVALLAAWNCSVAKTSTISAVAMTSTWATGVNWPHQQHDRAGADPESVGDGEGHQRRTVDRPACGRKSQCARVDEKAHRQHIEEHRRVETE
jgi:hypothetical protein